MKRLTSYEHMQDARPELFMRGLLGHMPPGHAYWPQSARKQWLDIVEKWMAFVYEDKAPPLYPFPHFTFSVEEPSGPWKTRHPWLLTCRTVTPPDFDSFPGAKPVIQESSVQLRDLFALSPLEGPARVS